MPVRRSYQERTFRYHVSTGKIVHRTLVQLTKCMPVRHTKKFEKHCSRVHCSSTTPAYGIKTILDTFQHLVTLMFYYLEVCVLVFPPGLPCYMRGIFKDI